MRHALLAVFTGRDAGLLFENAGEITLIVKAYRIGDLRDRDTGRTQQDFAALDAQPVDLSLIHISVLAVRTLT